MNLPYLLVFVIVLYVVTGHESHFPTYKKRFHSVHKALIPKNFHGDSAVCFGDHCKRTVYKRSLFSTIVKLSKGVFQGSKVIITVSSVPLLVSSLAYTLINAASDGCAFYPNICKNREKLKVLEEKCLELVTSLKNKYGDSEDTYERLRDITLNNIYIDEQLQGLSESANKFLTYSEEVDSKLTTNIIDGYNTTSTEELLNKTIDSIEYRFNNMEQQIQDLSNEHMERFEKRLVGTIIYYAGLAAATNFYKAYRYAGSATVLGKMGTAVKTVTLQGINYVANFKSKMANVVKHKVQGFNNLVKNPVGTVKNYAKGISLPNFFLNSVAVACNVAVVYIETKAWQKLDELVANAVDDYEGQKAELQALWNEAQAQTETLEDVQREAVGIYNDIVTEFANAIGEMVENNTDAINALNPNVAPETVPALVSTNTANESNILDKQNEFLRSTTDSKMEIGNYNSWILAMYMVVSSISADATAGKDVLTIFSTLTKILQMQPVEIQQYSSMGSLPSVVCVLSYLYPNSDIYGTFPLDSMRETCAIGAPESFPVSYIAQHEQLAEDFTIQEKVNDIKAARQASVADVCSFEYLNDPNECKGELSDIIDTLYEYFISDPLLNVNDVPSSKDVIYKIAGMFPKDDEFAFFTLSHFRDGNVMTDTIFTDLAWDADDARHNCLRNIKRAARQRCQKK